MRTADQAAANPLPGWLASAVQVPGTHVIHPSCTAFSLNLRGCARFPEYLTYTLRWYCKAESRRSCSSHLVRCVKEEVYLAAYQCVNSPTAMETQSPRECTIAHITYLSPHISTAAVRLLSLMFLQSICYLLLYHHLIQLGTPAYQTAAAAAAAMKAVAKTLQQQQ